MTSETRDGPTPHGGIKSVIYYRDDEGSPADKALATRVEIVELNASGEAVHRTLGTMTPTKAPVKGE